MKYRHQYLGLLFISAKAALAQQPLYAQCGGTGWNGGTTCVNGAVCNKINDFYSQCVPGTALPPPSSTSTAGPGPTSPPATPGQQPANMSPEWKSAWTKAQAAVTKLSVNDKVNLATGVQWQKGNCVGNIPAISSISFPGLCLEDGPLGVRFADLVSAFPAAINAASTFNRTLMRKRGTDMGAEFRGKGIHVALGPSMNIQRLPEAGRNWEAFGADPYLSGESAYETIKGIQSQGVQANAKHYINNEQEHFRESSSSVVDDRTQHEIYAYPFLRSVQANVASVMCSYNQINGSWACENDKMLNGILKGEFGFPGYVMSDWWATHSTNSVLYGLDMTMPGDIKLGSGTTYFGDSLARAVQSGTVSQGRLTDMATRILAAWYLLGQDSGFPAVNFNAWNKNSPVNQHNNVQSDHKSTIRAVGAASTVLLKNANNDLPLKAPKSLAIIGSGAGPNSRGVNGCEDRNCNDGVLAMGWGSGTCEFPYLTSPLDAITTRARAAGTTVSSSTSDTNLNAAASTAAGKDYAIVFITSDAGEGYITVEGHAGDRNDLKAWHGGDALVQRVASSNPRTIVVVNSVGPIEMESWINNGNVTAVVWCGLPGQEAGNSLADVLYGDYNPSGRLPYTIGKTINDYSAKVLYNSPSQVPTITYSEGLFIDYRHFERSNITPRFEFGFGLSYTTFSYSGLSVTGTAGGVAIPGGPGSSLDPILHEKVVKATFTLTNTGTVAGHEVPQLYIGLPSSTNSPPKSLKGFDSVFLQPGQSKTVTMELSRFDLAIWDVVTQRWKVPSGTTGIMIGTSSRDIRLTGSVTN